MKVKDLKQDGHNYRRHSDRNKALIKKSVEECGLGRSVVIDADGVLIAGNGVASVLDKHTPVRVVETDGSELVVVKRTDLHEGDVKRKKLAMADNAAADSVEWDVDALRADWGDDDLGEWDVDIESLKTLAEIDQFFDANAGGQDAKDSAEKVIVELNGDSKDHREDIVAMIKELLVEYDVKVK